MLNVWKHWTIRDIIILVETYIVFLKISLPEQNYLEAMLHICLEVLWNVHSFVANKTVSIYSITLHSSSLIVNSGHWPFENLLPKSATYSIP